MINQKIKVVTSTTVLMTFVVTSLMSCVKNTGYTIERTIMEKTTVHKKNPDNLNIEKLLTEYIWCKHFETTG